MAEETKRTRSAIIPTLRYQDAPAAIAWLTDVLGFEEHLVVPGEAEGQIAHAQLVLGSGMIMLGSARADEYGTLVQSPKHSDGLLTQAAYIVVAEIDKHYSRARAQGAEIVMELAPQEYGGKLYSCRDPEGQLWNIGSYDPWVDN